MAIVISLQPALSDAFERLRGGLDEHFYGESRKKSAAPKFDEFTIKGSGSVANEDVTIYRNSIEYIQLKASPSGSFTTKIEPDYDNVNHYLAVGSTSGNSNDIYLDIYKYLAILYILGLEYTKLIQKLGQAKQDIFVDQGVGDNVDGGFYEWEKDFTTSFDAVKGHMPIKVPSENWSTDFDELLRKAIQISENALVQSSIYNLREVFEKANCTDIWFWFQENFKWFDVDESHTPRVVASNHNQLTFPTRKIRMKWSVEDIMEVTITSLAAWKDKYVWFYVDETREADGSLEILTSLTQPEPKVAIGNNVLQVSGTGVGAVGTLTDSTKSWTINEWKNYLVNIYNRWYKILSNTATVLTIDTAEKIPSTTYEIWSFGGTAHTETFDSTRILVESGAGTGGTGTFTATTMGTTEWLTDRWKHCLLKLYGEYYLITASTATVLTLDTDDTLLDGNYEIYSCGIKMDTRAGDVTGSAVQRYVELDPAIYSLDSVLVAEDVVAPTNVSIDGFELINRRILALGKSTADRDVKIAYQYYREPAILCVMKVDNNGDYSEIHRTFSMPDHVRSMVLTQFPDIFVHGEFSTLPSTDVKEALQGILNKINPVYRPLYLFITSILLDQTEVVEDSKDWASYHKGFQFQGQA